MAWRGSGIWQRTGRGTERTPLLLKHTQQLKTGVIACTNKLLHMAAGWSGPPPPPTRSQNANSNFTSTMEKEILPNCQIIT